MAQSNVKLNSGGNPNQSQGEGFVENITNTVSDLASQGAEFVQNAVGDLPNTVNNLASQGAEYAQNLASQGSEYVENLSGNLNDLTSRGSQMLENRLSSLEDGLNTVIREWDEEKSITAGAAGLAAIGLVLGSKVDKKWFALSAIAGGLFAAHKYSNGAAIPALKKLAGDLGGGLGMGANIGGNRSVGTRIHENSNLRPSDLSSLDRSNNQGGNSNQGGSNLSGSRSNDGGNRNQNNGGNSSSNRNPM
ncbi:MAG: hypothetical protein V4642_03540 [Bacteroidota bacterium]